MENWNGYHTYIWCSISFRKTMGSFNTLKYDLFYLQNLYFVLLLVLMKCLQHIIEIKLFLRTYLFIILKKPNPRTFSAASRISRSSRISKLQSTHYWILLNVWTIRNFQFYTSKLDDNPDAVLHIRDPTISSLELSEVLGSFVNERRFPLRRIMEVYEKSARGCPL